MIEDVKTCEVFEFPCEEWFTDEIADGLSRELTYTDVTFKEKESGKGECY